MSTLPDLFAETSLGMLPKAERAGLLRALDTGTPARGLRLRPGIPADAVCKALDIPYAPVPWAAHALYLDAAPAAGKHPLHAAGAYYLQEPSAMAAVAALDIRPGQRVLDVCAAPGGKSTQIGGLLAGESVLVSNEPVPGRARVLSHNTERMGILNAIVTSELPDRLAARWPEWFDRILVDAPCSGEGMFRREPDSRAQWTPQAPQGCAARQAKILDAAAVLLHPGGLLVYSTCTFNAIENEETVSAFLARHPDFRAEDFTLAQVGASQAGCLRLWPHKVRGEGHFVARLRKAGPCREATPPEAKSVALADCFEGLGTIRANGMPVWTGDHLWLPPADSPDLAGIKVLRNGLAMGTRRSRQFLPEHAMALAFPPEAFARHLCASDEDAARFLRGETLAADGAAPGWTVVACRGLGLGWGKVSDGVLKNHLPKGLRRP